MKYLSFRNLFCLDPQNSYLYIFFFALVIHIFAAFLLPAQTWEYETIASNILQGRGFVYPHFGGVLYRSYCEPLYPFLCAAVYFFTHHSIFAMEFVQSVLYSLTAAVIYFCAKRIYGRKVALLAGILTAVHPGFIIYTVKLHPLVLDSLLISLTALLILRLYDDLTTGNLIMAGLVSGLCILSRPTILIFLPIGLITILRRRKIKFNKSIVYTAIFFIFASIVFLPWSIRNHFIQKEFMLTRSNTPFVFWLGNNPDFSGSAADKTGKSIFELSPQEFQKKINNLDEIGQNREFLRESFNYIKRFPFQFIERIVKKFYYFWWFNPQSGLLYPITWFLLYRIFYFFIFIFAITSIFFTYIKGEFQEKTKMMLIIMLLLSISLFQSLFYIETRHRWAIEPLFMIFVANGIHGLFIRIQGLIVRRQNENH